MPQKVHLSIHIEATTGTSFLAQLGKIYGADHVLHYNNQHKKLIRLSEIPVTPAQSVIQSGKKLLTKTPLINKVFPEITGQSSEESLWLDLDEIPEDTEVIHGHFTPDLFDGTFENIFLTLVLREPLERMVKQYRQWKRNQGQVDWRVTVPFDSDLPFREYAFLKEYRNYQSKYLGDKRLGDFDHLDIHLCQLRCEDWSEIPIQVKKPDYDRYLDDKKLDLDQEWLEEFQEYHEKDYYIYTQAKEFMGYI